MGECLVCEKPAIEKGCLKITVRFDKEKLQEDWIVHVDCWNEKKKYGIYKYCETLCDWFGMF